MVVRFARVVVLQNVVKMSKRKKKVVTVEQKPAKDLIKAVFELYAPNKFQLFMIKRFGLNAWFAGNKERVAMLQNVLGLSKEDVIDYELEFYLGWTIKRANG